MPGFTTHYLFGQQTYQQLHTSTLKRTIQKNHTAFCLGLQGPIFFSMIRFPQYAVYIRVRSPIQQVPERF